MMPSILSCLVRLLPSARPAHRGLALLSFVLALPVLVWAQFGLEPVGSTSAAQSITVKVAKSGTVSAVKVLTAGKASLDFAAGSGTSTCATGPVTKGGSCTESVTFTPAYPGLRTGAVVLLDNTGNALGTAYVNGIGRDGLGVLVPGNVVNKAGTIKKAGFGGDKGLATKAVLRQPSAVVLDGAGNMYISDTANNRIRRVDATTGIITTLAGTGDTGYSGDGGPASKATLNAPAGLALDGAGNLLLADSGNNVVRMIALAASSAAPVITTVAGNGNFGFGGDNGAATAATLSDPLGVTVADNGDIYIADTFNQRIRKVDIATGIIATVAGNGKPSGKGDGKGTYGGDGGPAIDAGLNQPLAVAFDTSGNMYIPDWQNSRIRKVDTGGNITTYAGTGVSGYSGDGGAATSAQISLPTGVLADPAGNIYISDSVNSAIRKVNAAQGTIESVIQDRVTKILTDANLIGWAQLYAPVGLFQDGKGNLYYADYYYMVIEEIEASTSVLDYTDYPFQRETRVGEQSAPEQQKLENDGNYALDLSSITPGKNTLVDTGTTTCSLSVALDKDTSCEVGVVFAPSLSIQFPKGTFVLQVIDQVEVDGFTDGTGTDAEDFPLEIEAVGLAEPVNATTTTVTSSSNPSDFGRQVTFTVTVTSGATAGTPRGKITLTDTLGASTTTLVSGLALDGTGKAVFTTSTPLALGVHTITANYTHSGSFLDSQGTLTQTVEEGTRTKLTSSANPSPLNKNVTFTATVTPTSGNLTPDGSVQWLIDNVVQSGSPLDSNGQSTFTTNTLTLGNHTVEAIYSGDTSKSILGSSAKLTEEIQTTSTTTLKSSLNPSFFGQAVTFTATVTGNGTVTPTGTVRFLDGNNEIGTAKLASGSAALTTASLAAGKHTITAEYNGDADYTGSTSNTVSQVVNLNMTTTTVSANPDPGIAGIPVAITATVKVTSGSATVTGTVIFTDALTGTTLGSAKLAGDAATIKPVLAPGSYSIVAAYSGDTNDSASTSSALPLTVKQATTNVTLNSSANPSLVGSSLTFTATVKGNGATPTGSVSFADTFGGKTTTLGSGNLNASGVATFPIASLVAGTHSITATYSGDTNDAGSTSTAYSQVIGKIDTVTGLASSATNSTPPVSFLVATVTDKTASASVPTGTITFLNAATNAVIGSAALDSNGVTSLTPNLPSGIYNIFATYPGDSTHNASTSAVVQFSTTASSFNLTVSPATVSVQAGKNISVAVEASSVGGFTDTIGLGCGSLPSGVNCHFASGELKLPANGTATTVLTIDTNNPLGGGGTSSIAPQRPVGMALAGFFAPLGILFGLVFWRFRRRHARALTLGLLLFVGTALMAISGCSGFTQHYAAPGTYTIQVVGVGSNSDTTHYENVKLTITAK